MFFRSLRRTFLAAWLRLFAGGISLFCASYEVIGPCGSGLLLPGLLLAGHRLLLTLAGTRVGLGPLPVHREPAAMADSLVAADLDLPPDVGLDLAAQVTFDLVGGVDPVTELHQVFVGKAVDPGVSADAGRLERLQRPGAADAVDIGERDLEPLIAGEVYSRKPGHVRAVLLRLAEVLRTASMPCPDMAPASVRGSQRDLAAAARVSSSCGGASALPLLVPRIGADDHDAAVPTDDPALAADLLDARLDLHGVISSYVLLVLLWLVTCTGTRFARG